MGLILAALAAAADPIVRADPWWRSLVPSLAAPIAVIIAARITSNVAERNELRRRADALASAAKLERAEEAAVLSARSSEEARRTADAVHDAVKQNTAVTIDNNEQIRAVAVVADKTNAIAEHTNDAVNGKAPGAPTIAEGVESLVAGTSPATNGNPTNGNGVGLRDMVSKMADRIEELHEQVAKNTERLNSEGKGR